MQALTPEDVRPFTKAAPRKATYVGRKIGRSRVLTDTPEKAEIEANYAKRHAGKGKGKGKGKLPTARALTSDVNQKSNTNTEDDDVWPCLVCCEPFGSSRSGEKWIQCTVCNKWSHEECTGGGMFYVCHNCDSD